MLDRSEIEEAIELQTKGYELLRWLEKAFNDGFIAPEAVHSYGTLEESARAWITRHRTNLPESARPSVEQLGPFSRFFSTYLDSTFDLDANPGQQLYSPEAHCFCPLCSWMVKVPHLKPKKVYRSDKRRAEDMKRSFVVALAAELDRTLSNSEADGLLGHPDLPEPIALCTYASDLLRRIKGYAVGPATLALWRGFAWTPEGSPKKGFKLTADDIMAAQDLIRSSLRC